MTRNTNGRAHPASLNRREIAPCVYYPSYPHPAKQGEQGQGREPSKQGNRAVICHRERGTGLQPCALDPGTWLGYLQQSDQFSGTLQQVASVQQLREQDPGTPRSFQPPAGQTQWEELRQQEVLFPGLASDKEEPLLRPRGLLTYGAQ